MRNGYVVICAFVFSRAATWKADTASQQLLLFLIWQARFLLRLQHKRVIIYTNLVEILINAHLLLYPTSATLSQTGENATVSQSGQLKILVLGAVRANPSCHPYIIQTFLLFVLCLLAYLNISFSSGLTQMRQRVNAGNI